MAGSNVVQAIGPSYHLNDVRAACQAAVNTYVSRLDGTNQMLASSPGEATVAAFGVAIRGQHVAQPSNRWFVAAGNVLYELTAGPTAGLYEFNVIGSLATSSGFVGMAHNATQLSIVDGPNYYVLNLNTSVLTPITALAWRGSDDVQELDGYFIFVDPETDQFYLTAIDDGTTLNGLDFSSADSSPDNIITHRVSHRQLFLLGADTTEIWIDSGAAAFPFVRYNSYTMDVGVVGKQAAIVAADTLFWIGKTKNGRGLVYSLAGNQPMRVSNSAVEQALAGSSDLSQASMWAYQIEGHEFIGINAPGLATTWVYDAALQMWHERAEWDAGWQPLRTRSMIAHNGLHFGGDAFGDVVRLDADLNSLSGRPLVRERTWPHFIQPSLEPVSYLGLEVAAKTGSGSGVMTLEISNDGGYVWNAPLPRGLGAVGRRTLRLRWLGLGSAANRVFRLRCSDDVPWSIYSATVST